MKISINIFFTLLVTLFFSITALSQDCYIASFNTLRLGQNKKNLPEMARALKEFSIVGLIEVMNKKGVEELIDELEEITDEEWDYFISPYSTGTEKYQEFYAFIWKTDEVKFLDNLGFYDDPQNIFVRSPFGASFKINNFDFYFILAHSIYGRKKSLREREAFYFNNVYNYFQNLSESENDVIMGGDFNLSANNKSFEPLTKKNADSVIFAVDPTISTTIGTKGFANPYDNIFLSKKYTDEFTGVSGVYDFTEGKYEYSREWISDHLPVFITIDCSRSDDD